jgi:diguanylate cyclase (GGDEF)-like protein
VCRKLKADERTAVIPIIFLTGASDVFNKVHGFDLGAIDYVTKPFEAAELRARVRSALRMKRYHDLLAQRAHVDALTGLWNRRYFDGQLAARVDGAVDADRRMSLLILDIDHFKKLNDTFGHPFGDQVLQLVGELVAAACRKDDLPCRIGGEEFAIILRDADAYGAIGVAKRLRARLTEAVFRPKGQPLRVTASFGLAIPSGPWPTSVERCSHLLGSADGALYRAKGLGRDLICVACDLAPVPDDVLLALADANAPRAVDARELVGPLLPEPSAPRPLSLLPARSSRDEVTNEPGARAS